MKRIGAVPEGVGRRKRASARSGGTSSGAAYGGVAGAVDAAAPLDVVGWPQSGQTRD